MLHVDNMFMRWCKYHKLLHPLCLFKCLWNGYLKPLCWKWSGKSLPGGPGTTQQHNDILKMTAEFNPNRWLTFQASLELLFQCRVVPSIFMFLLNGSTVFFLLFFFLISNHMPVCVFLFKSRTCFLSGECDGQRGGRLWGQLAPSPWRAAVPGSALCLHGATGLANPQSPKPRLQEEWVSSFLRLSCSLCFKGECVSVSPFDEWNKVAGFGSFPSCTLQGS